MNKPGKRRKKNSCSAKSLGGGLRKRCAIRNAEKTIDESFIPPLLGRLRIRAFTEPDPDLKYLE
jgi:hypothetical protein